GRAASRTPSRVERGAAELPRAAGLGGPPSWRTRRTLLPHRWRERHHARFEPLQRRVDIEISESGLNTLPRGQLRGVICDLRAKSRFGVCPSLRCLYVDCGALLALYAVQFPAPPQQTPTTVGV